MFYLIAKIKLATYFQAKIGTWIQELQAKNARFNDCYSFKETIIWLLQL